MASATTDSQNLDQSCVDVMCEPVYCNIWSSVEATSTVTTGSCGVFLKGTKLNEAIYDVQRSLKRSEPPKELGADKFRWMIINITNETQFTLKFEREWFEVGRFWDAPSNVAAFSRSFFSGCNTFWGGVGYHGVSGAVLFYIQIPGQPKTYPITIAFSFPGIGIVQTRAEFTQDMKEIWRKMDKHRTHSDEVDLGIQRTKFKLVSTPGSQAMVTLTQICEEDEPETRFLDRVELNEAICKTQQHFSTLIQPAKGLKERYRWIVINIANETQFSLRYEKEWFDVGRFWDAPSNIAPFSYSSFSGTNTSRGAAGYHGVSGSVQFYLLIPGELEKHSISVAYSNPGTGSIKTRAEFSPDMKDVWKRMDRQCTYNTEKVIGRHDLKFQLTSTPGNQAKVTLTQEYSQ